MSISKIEKQLSKPRPDRNGTLRYVSAILVDDTHPDLLPDKLWFRQITSLMIKDCHVVQASSNKRIVRIAFRFSIVAI